MAVYCLNNRVVLKLLRALMDYYKTKIKINNINSRKKDKRGFKNKDI